MLGSICSTKVPYHGVLEANGKIWMKSLLHMMAWHFMSQRSVVWENIKVVNSQMLKKYLENHSRYM